MADILKKIKGMQKEFLEKPREHIENLVKAGKDFTPGLIQLGIEQNMVDMLLVYRDFFNQYSDLIGKMLEERLIAADSFKDDTRDVAVLQSIAKMKMMILHHDKGTLPPEECIPQLLESYASLLEILWNKLKRTIFFAGLNPDEKHLNLWKIEKKLEQLEKKYSVDLSRIKEILEGRLRNCVNHEKKYFEHPNFIVFFEEKNGKYEEFDRITGNELIGELIRIFTIIMALHKVETTVIISQVEQLLKLSDEELKEYCKTGKLTQEMQEKIKGSKKDPAKKVTK